MQVLKEQDLLIRYIKEMILIGIWLEQLGQRKEEVCLTHKPLKSMVWHLFLMMVMLSHCIIHNREVLDHCLKLLHVIIIFPMQKKDRSIHIKVNLIRLTRWIVIQEVYSQKWILLNIGKQEEEML